MEHTVSFRKPPKHRSSFRLRIGMAFYGLLRKGLWLTMRRSFAHEFSSPLPWLQFAHQTVLLRTLKDVDMQYQYNKIVNLNLAVAQLDGIVLHPGEIFSYWRLIGKPSARKGYISGMVLKNGAFTSGIGGGLCQLSNLIYWLTLHTPLTVAERHRHGYDVFPDSNRTQPFGSGATCFYPHGDLMIRNDTQQDFQLKVWVGETYLHGQWRSTQPPHQRYEIVERNHKMRGEYWGGYTRHNELYRQIFDLEGNLLQEEFVTKNDAVMMYAPLLAETYTSKPYKG